MIKIAVHFKESRKLCRLHNELMQIATYLQPYRNVLQVQA